MISLHAFLPAQAFEGLLVAGRQVSHEAAAHAAALDYDGAVAEQDVGASW